MTLNIPKWLDEKFLHSCLEDTIDNGEVVIKSYETSSVAPPGNGFLGVLIRVKLAYQRKKTEEVQQLSIIVKGPLGDGCGFYFETEPKFYQLFMRTALEISPNERFAPKSYFTSVPGVVVMEDLNSEGYTMADKNKMLDYEHCKLYAIAGATFHAVSVAVHEKSPTLVESLGTEKFFSNDNSFLAGMKKLFIAGLRRLADKMESFEEYKKYADIIHSSSVRIWDMMVEALRPNPTFNALTQSDPWTPNMMFKYESGKAVDIRLLDFQGLRYSSPVADLIFFTYTSPTYEVRENRLEDVYRVYCDTLNRKLEDLNCSKRFTYEELVEGLRLLSCKALFIASTSFPILMCQKSVDTGAIFLGQCDDDMLAHALEQYYDSDYCNYHLPKVLKQLDSAGAFRNVISQLGEETK